jgi:hypothetical protein
MHKLFAGISLLVFLSGCGTRKQVPDTSNIPMDLQILRFDKAFFAMDSDRLAQGLQHLNQVFPFFTNDFTAHILDAGPLSDTNRLLLPVTRKFLCSYLPVKDSIGSQFENLDWLEKNLKQNFRMVKYYFPDCPVPERIVTFIGPFDAPGIALTRYALGIGLQLYAGRNFPFYTSMEGQELYPMYISRRFEKQYIPSGCILAIAGDLFPDSSGDRPLIEQMIQKGKYWWLASQLMPETPDSLFTGFTQKQLDWCNRNEGLIWNSILQNVDIYSIDPDLIKNYIGDAPNTNGMTDQSPGNIGQWIGWQIVKKYASGLPNDSLRQIMMGSTRKIFEEAKYKPR